MLAVCIPAHYITFAAYGTARRTLADAVPPLPAATGSSHSVASGRISFVLGMQGPCVSYDTACSAALAANHAALRALQHRECVAALSVGVSMMLLPGVGITFATAGMLSAGGHCHTFDSRADGYVRGEACCAATLRVSSFAAHDTLRLVGSCVRQDGKSASLTAPNGQAQRALLWAALADAAMLSDQVACVEAHGTGTALGDPIEARSLASLHTERQDDEALAVGSVKANGGHAEPAAGITGLLRLAVGVRDRVAPPNSQLRAVNPHVVEAFDGISCTLPTQLSAAPACYAQASGLCAGGVSSFGYSGTIVHALLQDDGGGGQAPVDSVPVRFNRRRFPWPRPAIVAAADEAELLSFGFSWVDSDVPEAGGHGGLDWLLIGERKQVGPASRVYHEQPSKVTALSEVGGKSVRNVVLLAETHDAAAPSMLGMSTLLAVTRQLIQMKPPPRLLCLCRGTQHPRPLELAEPMAAASAGGVWGFLRSVALEQPAADWLIRDVRSEPSATEVARMLRAAAAFGEDGGVPRELAQSSSGTWHAPRLVRTGAIPSSADSVSGAGVNIITGGSYYKAT